MPDSLISQLVNNAWEQIANAVSDGLAFGGQKTLPDVMTVLAKHLPDTAWQPRTEVEAGGGRRWVRQSATLTAFDCLHRLPLDYDSLRSPDVDSIREWAASARRFELQHMLDQLAGAAMRHDFIAGGLPAATAEGWGQLRCVTFRSNPGDLPLGDDLAKMDWDGPVRTDIVLSECSFQALLFRLGGGPYVQRPADLTLGWVPGTGEGVGVDLVLTEQLNLVNARKETVTGIRVVRQ